jgi:hypothetical protein
MRGAFPQAEMELKQTPVPDGPKVPTMASERMAETSGLSVSDAGGGPMSAKPTSNSRLPSESTTGVSIARSASRERSWTAIRLPATRDPTATGVSPGRWIVNRHG